MSENNVKSDTYEVKVEIPSDFQPNYFNFHELSEWAQDYLKILEYTSKNIVK